MTKCKVYFCRLVCAPHRHAARRRQNVKRDTFAQTFGGDKKVDFFRERAGQKIHNFLRSEKLCKKCQPGSPAATRAPPPNEPRKTGCLVLGLERTKQCNE